MMSVMICAVICGLIAVITESNNRLIQGQDEPSHSSTRRLVDVAKFVGGKDALLGVALISFRPPRAKKFVSFCTGAYVKAPAGVKGKFVVTAAHCMYDRETARFLGQLDQWRVEFGVAGGWAPGTHGIVQCQVADIRISNQYPIVEDGSTAFSYDYAVLQVEGDYCDPTHPFTIEDFSNSKKTQDFELAGYGGSRKLEVFGQVRVRHSEYKSGPLLKHMMVGAGGGREGDSGGPIYKKEKGHVAGYKLQAVYSGQVSSKSGALEAGSVGVKIYKALHDQLDDFMRGVDGISATTTDCSAGDVKSRECWTKCVASKPGHCFAAASQSRGFADPAREMKCSVAGTTRRYLCGPISKCSGEKATRKCLTDCKNIPRPQPPPRKVCGSRRSVLGHNRCYGRSKSKSFDGYEYVCSGSGGGSAAHSDVAFANLLRMFDYGYYLGYKDNI